MQGMLTHVVVHQPEDPIAYFHEELSKIKKEVEENNVSLYILSTVLVGSQHTHPYNNSYKRMDVSFILSVHYQRFYDSPKL